MPPFEILQMVENGTAQIVSFHLKPAYPHSSAVIDPLLAAIPGGDSSEEVSRLREMSLAAAAEEDDALRVQKYQELERQVLELALVIPAAMFTATQGYLQPWVRDFSPPKFGGSMFYDVWMEDPPERSLP